MRASPFPQQRLCCKRETGKRTVAIPSGPCSRTSHDVPWPAPQKSTDSEGLSLLALKTRFAALGSFCAAAATCLAPGPWHASHVMPGTTSFGLSGLVEVSPVAWQATGNARWRNDRYSQQCYPNLAARAIMRANAALESRWGMRSQDQIRSGQLGRPVSFRSASCVWIRAALAGKELLRSGY